MPYHHLSNDEKCDLRDDLLKHTGIKDPTTFALLLGQLPAAITEQVQYSALPSGHILNLIDQCTQYRDGIEQLLWAVATVESRESIGYGMILKRVRSFIPLLIDDALLNKAHDAIKALYITSAELTTFYHQCLPPAFSSHMSTREPSRSVMLCLLAGIPEQQHSVYPLPDFIVTIYNHYRNHKNSDALNDLSAVYREMRLALGLTQTDEKRLVEHALAHPALNQRQNSYLMVACKSQEIDPVCFEVKAWLVREPVGQGATASPPEPIYFDTQTDKVTCTLADIGTILTQLIDRALDMINDEHDEDLIIELFMPQEAFDHDFEELEIRGGIGDLVKLGTVHPLLMRQVERLDPMYKRSMNLWRKRWSILQARIKQRKADPTHPAAAPFNVIEWFTNYRQSDDQLYNAMHNIDKVPSVVFALQRPSSGSELTRRLFFAALRTAVPAAIWYRRDQPIDAQVAANLEALMAQNEALPQELLKLRREAADPNNQNLDHIGNSITLLWENPHRRPPSDKLEPIQQASTPLDRRR